MSLITRRGKIFDNIYDKMIKFDKLIAKGNTIMYKNSEILEIIMKKYKLKLGMKLDILLLNTIKQIEEMEIKDLIYILEINPNTIIS